MKIRYLAFRGVGKFRKNIGKLPGLIIAGHVGLQFEDDPTIYGFHPTPEAEEKAGSEENLLKLLKEHQEQPGCVQDDTEIFLMARDKENLVVKYITYDFPEEKYQEIKATVDQWYNEKRRFWYNLPFDTEEGGFPEGQYNCSTFPILLGMQVPDESGYIKYVIDAMEIIGAEQWTQ